MLTETRQTLRQTARGRGAAHFFDLGGPSQYSGNYLIGFEHCEPGKAQNPCQNHEAPRPTPYCSHDNRTRCCIYAPPRSRALRCLLLYLLHTYYTMIVAELGFRMLERDTFHTKLVRY